MVDYRKLLLAYIDTILNAEGVHYMAGGRTAGLAGLTDEENVELAKVRDLSDIRPELRYYDENGKPING